MKKLENYSPEQQNDFLEDVWRDCKQIEFEGYRISAIPYIVDDMEDDSICYLAWECFVESPPEFINSYWGEQSLYSWHSSDYEFFYDTDDEAREAGIKAILDNKIIPLSKGDK